MGETIHTPRLPAVYATVHILPRLLLASSGASQETVSVGQLPAPPKGFSLTTHNVMLPVVQDQNLDAVFDLSLTFPPLCGGQRKISDAMSTILFFFFFERKLSIGLLLTEWAILLKPYA